MVAAILLGNDLALCAELEKTTLSPKWKYCYTPPGDAMNMGLYDAALDAEGSVFLLLYGDHSHSRLLKVDGAGKQVFCADLNFGAYSIAVGEAGVYAVGYHRPRRPPRSPRPTWRCSAPKAKSFGMSSRPRPCRCSRTANGSLYGTSRRSARAIIIESCINNGNSCSDLVYDGA